MRHRYERQPPERRRGIGCLAWLVILVWAVLLLVLGYRYLFREQVSQYVGQQIGSQLSQQIESQIQQGAQTNLPTVIAGLPSGELRISEAQANEYLAANAEAFRPIESFIVRFVPGAIQADIRAFGLSSSAQVGLAVQDGRVIAVQPQLEGPLDQVLSIDDLLPALERQLNAELAAQGRRATDVRVEQGEVVVMISDSAP